MFELTAEERPSRWVEEDPEPPADLLWQLTMEAENAEEPERAPSLPAFLADWIPAPYLGVVLSDIRVDVVSLRRSGL